MVNSCSTLYIYCDMIPSRRVASLFTLVSLTSTSQIEQVALIPEIVEKVFDGVGIVVLPIVNVLQAESVDPVFVQVATRRCERWRGVTGYSCSLR